MDAYVDRRRIIPVLLGPAYAGTTVSDFAVKLTSNVAGVQTVEDITADLDAPGFLERVTTPASGMFYAYYTAPSGKEDYEGIIEITVAGGAVPVFFDEFRVLPFYKWMEDTWVGMTGKRTFDGLTENWYSRRDLLTLYLSFLHNTAAPLETHTPQS